MVKKGEEVTFIAIHRATGIPRRRIEENEYYHKLVLDHQKKYEEEKKELVLNAI
ncbi:MAG: hypothetical protein ACFFAJ_14220 [Candidatus Hodarchaeota archaeon]